MRAIELLCFSLLAVVSRSEDSAAGELEVCDGSSVEITSLEVLCDSPGSYYYGSTGYRKADTCAMDDKAHVYGTFDIVDNLYNTYVYTTINANAMGEEFSVNENVLLCQLDNLKSTTGVTCPAIGSYKFHTKFMLESTTGQTTDDASMFVPTVEVSFSSTGDSGSHDLGGANIQCSGNAVNEWWKSNTSNGEGGNGLSFFSRNGLLLFVVVLVSGFGCILYSQSRSLSAATQGPQINPNDKILVDFEGQPL